MISKKPILNNVKNRFLPIPETASKCLEPEAKITDFEIVKQLGAGSFGHVFLVVHKVTKVQYAIKAIDKRDKTNQEEKPYFRREIEIMYKIHHPNVVRLFGHFEDNNYCYFIMEYISKGNIYGMIPKDNKKRLSTQVVATLMRGIISAVYFLHHMNPPIIHRDIKPENVLLSNDISAKLTDFGWSNYMSDGEKRTTVCGTPIYLAPEIINEEGHNEKVDNWCIGVLLFELCTGKVPFAGNDIDTLKNNIKHMRIEWPRDINTDAKNLISKILKYNPAQRMELEDMLKHPFFTKFFPNTSESLIKPNEKVKYKPFIISKDDPKTWLPLEDGGAINKVTIPKEKEGKITARSKSRSRSGDKVSKIKRDMSPLRSKGGEVCPISKYNELLAKYDSLKSEYNTLKLTMKTQMNSNSESSEIEKLREELKVKEETIKTLTRQVSGITGKELEDSNFADMCETLEKENSALKQRIIEYETYIKQIQETNIDNKYKELRDSINGDQQEKFKSVFESLKMHLDEQAKKDLMMIISEKDKEIERCKEFEKQEREKDKKKYTTLINKYDKTLNWIEKENKELKAKILEMERKNGN